MDRLFGTRLVNVARVESTQWCLSAILAKKTLFELGTLTIAEIVPVKSQGAPPDFPLTYRPDIDGLRAVAVLSVAGFHAFPEAIKAGFIGVDIFFVISGFLISTIILSKLDRNTFSAIEFYGGRVRRLFPALLLVLIAVCVAGWITLFAAEYAQLGRHIAAGAGFVANFVIWADSGYFQNASALMLLLHLWSLGIEEQFYIVWPFLLWASYRIGIPPLATIITGFVLSFFWNIRDIVAADMVAAFYSPQTRGWELLIGAAVACLALRRKSAADAPLHTEAIRNVSSLVGVGLIIVGLLSITRDREFPGWLALLPTTGTALIIAAGPQAWFNRFVLSRRLLVWLGLISYPLYLWHWPLLAYARIATDGEPSIEMRVGLLTLSVVLAWLTYRLVEAPVRFGGHRRLKTAILLASMVLVGVAGYAIHRASGLPARFTSNIDR
ncbi:MAG: acyltransferase, partial [Alphaproteobacteria bacterium]|nr:acyltransferase [Alphaproteobacteria bacterium]